jgi:hypothetical protein
MTELVSQMTKEELRMLIDEAIEQKFLELFGDPDEGLELRDEVREFLIRQREIIARGEMGRSLNEVAKELGID